MQSKVPVGVGRINDQLTLLSLILMTLTVLEGK